MGGPAEEFEILRQADDILKSRGVTPHYMDAVLSDIANPRVNDLRRAEVVSEAIAALAPLANHDYLGSDARCKILELIKKL